MSVNTAFQPVQGQNQNLSASTTSAVTSVTTNTNQLRIVVKAGGGDLFVYTYKSSNTSAVRAATLNDFCIVAGQSTVFTRAQGHDTVAYITDTGTANFKLIPGEGM